MAYTFRRASKSLLATSSTTAFAFMANGFSSLMPISAFGWFAFVIIPVNYVLIVLYFPAYLIVYENNVRELENKILSYIWYVLKCGPCKKMDCSGLCLQIFLDRFEYDLDKSSTSEESNAKDEIMDEVYGLGFYPTAHDKSDSEFSKNLRSPQQSYRSILGIGQKLKIQRRSSFNQSEKR